MGILSVRARLSVFLWVSPLVCGGPLCDRFCAVSRNYCVVQDCVICGKKSRKVGSCRRVTFEMLELAMTWEIVSV